MAEEEGQKAANSAADETQENRQEATVAVKKSTARKGVVKKTASTKKSVKKASVKKRSTVKKRVAKKKVAAKTAASGMDDVAAVGSGADTAKIEAANISEQPFSTSSPETDRQPPLQAAESASGTERVIKAEPKREESVNMSTASTGGFWPKIILSLIIILASFMYIRSLAHKGVEATKGSAAPVTSQTTAKSGAAATDAQSGSDSQESPAVAESNVAKVGEVAIETKNTGASEQKPTHTPEAASKMTDSTPPTEVDAKAAAATLEAAVEVPATGQASAPESSALVQSKADRKAATENMATIEKARTVAAVEEKPVAPEKSELSGAPTASAVAAEVVVDQPSAAAAASTGEVSVVPAVAVPAEAAKAEQVATTEAPATSQKSVAQTDSAAGAGEKEQQAAPVAQTADKPAAVERPSFKELFGYERPRPGSARQAPEWVEEARQGAAEEMARMRRMDANPWRYAPRQPQWNQGYPGQYGVPYGGYPAAPTAPYPQMPEWAAPYQPYNY
ncbi:MAG: hypothetical protein KDI68_15515 [Gammaproteobacteria bacterium]|nr:hypothetical protein [Gammaproteobacteria bacterium]